MSVRIFGRPISSSSRTLARTGGHLARRPRQAEEEEDLLELDNLGDFKDDDIPAMAHLRLDDYRERLHYLRLIEYQLPQLERFRRAYSPPRRSACVQLRTQHYQGEQHPVERKATISVTVADLELSSHAALHKFLLLAGPRYDPYKGIVKISCEDFADQRMNIKWCDDTLQKMLDEARNGEDKMEDIPLDLTHAIAKKAKRKATASLADFPREWLHPPSNPRRRPVSKPLEVGKTSKVVYAEQFLKQEPALRALGVVRTDDGV